MIRTAMLAAAVLSFATTPATAQGISQGELQSRYDRALAAGYKALFLCSAIANAERMAARRDAGNVGAWELAGIQSPLDGIVADLDHRIWRFRDGEGAVSHVEVDWTEDMAPRLAWHREEGGCTLAPIGTARPPERASVPYAEGYYHFHQRIPDETSLSNVLGAAFGSGYGVDARTTAVIVAGDEGDGVFRYTASFTPATPQRTWSVAKSIAATIVGAAVQRREADVNASAGLGENDDDPRRAITIDHALRMAIGRYSDTPGNSTDPLYFGGATVDEVARDWPLVHAPGTVWRYANNDTLVAIDAIEDTFDNHPPSELFAMLGMSGTVAETDWQGGYVLSSQVWAPAPDLLRLGQLYLNDGVVPDGTRILPEGWVEYVSTPSGPQPEGGRGWGYGAGWWLLDNSDTIPADTILAAGNRGQYIVVIPSRDIVIVRRGEDPAGGSGFDIEAFTRDVLAALGD
ncbi:MAG: serine hydrolase [Alteraurantiacibacter sp.]